MTAAEHYTSQFYNWEYRGRGWMVSEYAVQLEPPFIPFFRHGYHTEQIDDGKKHTLLSKAIEQIKGKKKIYIREQEPLDYETITPFEDEEERQHKAIQIKLPKDRKVSPEKMKALLVMLSYTHTPISFELIGTATEIVVQFVSDDHCISIMETYIHAYFPNYSVIQNDKYIDGIFREDLATTVVDFGLKHEFVRPISISKGYGLDPLTGVMAVLERLSYNEQAGIQILFSPTANQWTESILRSVTMYDGTSFFIDVPEAPILAKEKVQSQLYGVSIRSFAQATELTEAFQLLENISVGILQGTKGTANELIPLSDEAYCFQDRATDILFRESHRLGMILSTDELTTLLHFPSESIHSKKLFAASRKTKETPAIAQHKEYILGENFHNGIEEKVSISIEERLKHLHIIGATGTGKSTLIANLILQDIEKEVGVILFDPHGDLVNDIIERIPPKRLKDVVLIDPADIEYPIGLNILQAYSDIEKEVLSSDLVAAFKRYSTSWGDQMNTVFGNAILAILEHKDGGTLHDLRRLLIEKDFRNHYLKGVADPAVNYYWQKEYPLLKTNSIGPILTRLDTFLRPKSLRNMLIQKGGIDFEALLHQNKIILLKLSQGLIGVENSFLLGSLLLSKIHQAIFRRQQQANRKPVFIYLDEFQNFITPSIKEMLSGIRKYSAGLILSHQDLHQIQDTELVTSILGNVNTRIAFRIGEPDAKRLQDGFSGFDYTDFQNLGKGEAIVRIEQPQFDCSLNTKPLIEVIEENKTNNRETVVLNAREKYAKAKEEVEQMFWDTLKLDNTREEKITPPPKEKIQQPKENIKPIITEQVSKTIKPVERPPKEEATERQTEKQPSTHRYLQMLVKNMAEARGYTAILEQQLPNGNGQVDVLLSKEGKTIAVEISITTDADWEMHNIEKCIAAKYDMVISLSGDPKQLDKIKKKCIEAIPDFETKPVSFYTPDALFSFLEVATKGQEQEEQIIKGYRVNVSYDNLTQEEMARKRASVAKVVMESIRKQRKK